MLTVYGIETEGSVLFYTMSYSVATVLTVYGIETVFILVMASLLFLSRCNSAYRLRY